MFGRLVKARRRRRHKLIICVDFLGLFSAQENECDCPFACESIEYTTKISQAPYPTETLGRERALIDLKRMNKTRNEGNIQKRLKFYR